MGFTRLIHYAAFCALASSPVAAEKLTKADRIAIASSPEQVAAKVEVKNEPLDIVISVSTEPFTPKKLSGWNPYGADKFLRAFIDKKTGTAKFQIYFWTSYLGNDWQFLTALNYETPAGPVQAKAERLSGDVSCGRIGCNYMEHLIADIPESILREASQGAEAGTDDQWGFRIYAKQAEPLTTSFLKTEIAGLLIVVDREIATLKK
jgi:hypothetical protein